MEANNFTYTYPITVRYSDLDPQGHVNNAAYLTYMESARLGYYRESGIWFPNSGKSTGFVVARVEIDYLAPILFGQLIQVGVRLARMGEKSLTFEFLVEIASQGSPAARGIAVMVAYDNATGQSRLIPPEIREKLNRFEGLDEDHETT
jgi:acyl-CoA thioester hydrolase